MISTLYFLKLLSYTASFYDHNPFHLIFLINPSYSTKTSRISKNIVYTLHQKWHVSSSANSSQVWPDHLYCDPMILIVPLFHLREGKVSIPRRRPREQGLFFVILLSFFFQPQVDRLYNERLIYADSQLLVTLPPRAFAASNIAARIHLDDIYVAIFQWTIQRDRFKSMRS